MARHGRPPFPGRNAAFGGNMQQMLKQVQKLQSDMQNAQEEVQSAEVEGSAGGGAVNCRLNGQHQLISLEIKPEVIDPEDPEMLQDLIIAAVNQAAEKLAKLSEEKLGRFEQAGAGMMSGLGGLF